MKNNKNKVILLFTLVFAISISAFGDNYKNVDCSKPEGNPEFKYCVRLDYEKSDKELNATYNKLKRKLNDEEKKLLLTAQRAWLKLRDNHCELVAFDNKYTTGWSSQLDECLKEETVTRTSRLKKILESKIYEEKDPSPYE